MKTYDGEPLNILHTIGLDVLYPVVRVALNFKTTLNRERFETALNAVCQVVPELQCRYEMITNQWIQVTDNVDDLIFDGITNVDQHAQKWDLMTQPQLRVYWCQTENRTRLVFYVSHILTDGAGTKQLLYLIAQAYTAGASSLTSVHNSQDISWLEAQVQSHQVSPARKTDHPDEPLRLPKLSANQPQSLQVGHVTLTSAETRRLIDATHQAGVTVNDVVMATFGRVMQNFAGTHSIAMACPTDMRQFTKTSANTTQIANMTSRYNLTIDTELTEPLVNLVARVHTEMMTHKQERQCFDSIVGLLTQYHNEPLAKLQQVVEDNYHVREIAYTNFGVIDAQRLRFDQAPIDDVVMTGGFRQAPMYQIAAGTFNGCLTLAFNMTGSETEFTFGMALARYVRDLTNQFALDTLMD